MSENEKIKVSDFDMPFMSMVGFMVKWAFAAIPAFLIIGLLWMTIVAIAASLF